MPLFTSQISRVRNLRERGFSIRDIKSITGYARQDIVDVANGTAQYEAELRAEGKRMLRLCPRGRDPVEHERIVTAVFGDVTT